MAKSDAERQAARRARLKEEGTPQKQLMLELQEMEMLQELCAARRPGKAPYSAAELVGLLIRADHAKLSRQLNDLKSKPCKKCGDIPPINECPCAGDSQCWVTRGSQKLAIKL